MHILITGATGFIGKNVTRKCLTNGDTVTIISRSAKRAKAIFSDDAVNIYEHDLNSSPLPADIFCNVDAIVNLLGESIANKRWTKKQKQILYNSRIDGTKNLLANLQTPIKAIVSSSALGIYDTADPDSPWDESSEHGESFLATICKDWEKAATVTSNRTVLVRIGAALGKDGGILQQLIPVFRLGLGGRISSGKQVMSWMHVQDIAELIYQAIIDDKFEGPVNAVVGTPISNMKFTKSLAQALNRPAIFPVPKFALKVMLGSEFSKVAIENQAVVSKKLSSYNFIPRYKTIEEALENIVSS